MRRFLYLSLASLACCAAMLFAAFVAQASSPVKVGWMIPQEVSQSGDALSAGPQMAVDITGTVHLIWMDDTPGQADLYYIKSTDQGITWSDGEYVTTPLESEDGSLAVDSIGRVHACWCEKSYDQHSLLHAQRSASGWSLQPTAVVTESKCSYPTIAEAAGDLHVVWSNKVSYQGASLYYIRKPTSGGAWSDASVVADTAPASLYARMAVDTSDNLHVVWQEYTSPYEMPYEIMYVSGTVGTETTWSTPITVSAGLTQNATTPDIHVDSVVHIVFAVDVEGQEDTQDVYYVSFPVSNTGNVSPTVIPGSRVEVSTELPTWASPSIVLDGADNLHVVWNGIRGGDIYDRIYHVVSDDQGASWSQPKAISPDDAWPDGFPFIASDGNLVHVAWQQKGVGSDNDIYYSHSLPISTLLPLALKGYS